MAMGKYIYGIHIYTCVCVCVYSNKGPDAIPYYISTEARCEESSWLTARFILETSASLMINEGEGGGGVQVWLFRATVVHWRAWDGK